VNKPAQSVPAANKSLMLQSVERIWPSTQDLLRTMLNADIYNLWFAPIQASRFDGESITLEVANDFCEVWLKDNYLGLIQDALMHASGQPIKVKFKVGTDQSRHAAAIGEAGKLRRRGRGSLPQVNANEPR